MSIPKINNCDAAEYVDGLRLFNGANTFSENHIHLYIVYSYGYHFPMYIYDRNATMWFGNKDKYSVTTSKHQSQARPTQPVETWLDTNDMKLLVRQGSMVDFLFSKAKIVEAYRQEVVSS